MNSQRKPGGPAAHPGLSLGRPGREWELRLYISGQTPHSLAAIVNLKKICEDHVKGRYDIEFIDVMHNAARAREDQIVAIPTLLRRKPLPFSRIIGDLSDTARTMSAMQIPLV